MRMSTPFTMTWGSHFTYFITVFLMMAGCSSSSRAAT
jgi:hypothetical protein